jgi:hypothetical protein
MSVRQLRFGRGVLPSWSDIVHHSPYDRADHCTDHTLEQWHWYVQHHE